ncbi:DUF563 domain-containing protein [Microvirga aerilata]|uniref:DUF563 domain-containing protein n=1 Tax=Microvirga aerilata TaxID=670292 RepID=A0A937D1V7_9HYPH|nr:glycosyltransferase 61 family protein [Microvirga aerilata]MBL0406307.1 DUF563 domain-containing protein [Microvirga aerilata]
MATLSKYIEVSPARADDLATVSEPVALQYSPLPQNGFLIAPTEDSHYLARPIDLVRRTSSFQIAAEKNVRLMGFRSYITEQGKLFLDESLLNGFSWEAYARKFKARRSYEDYTAVFLEDSAFLKEDGDVINVDEAVISLASDEPSNYGSWIYRIIPKLIGVNYQEHPIFVYQNSKWMKGLLDFCFGSELTIKNHWPHRQYHLSHAVIPTPRNVDVYFDQEVVSFYETVAKRVAESSRHEKIYLSRQGQSIRPLVNEAELIALLISRGFEIIRPEVMGLKDQIRVIRDAKVIVCPGGSGLFNCVFASNAEFVLDLEAGHDWVYAHHNLLRSSGKHHTIVFGRRQNDDGPHAPWTVDLTHVVQALDHAGV